MIHYFNPGHETAVSNGSIYYMPPANVARMQKDLSFLPAWYAQTGDYVLIDNSVNSAACLQYLKETFPGLPQAITTESLNHLSGQEVTLWGISPQAIHFFTELKDKHSLDVEIPSWKNDYVYLNSREAAKDCLEKVIEEIPEISKNLIPCFCKSLHEVEDAVNISYPALIKAPYSSSGRGLLWLSAPVINNKEKEIVHGFLKKQEQVSVERALHKVSDFSMQFLCDGKGSISFEGYSFFETSSKGAYSGNYLYSQDKIIDLISTKISPALLEKVKSSLINILKEKYAHLYKGIMGVDMMIYEENGEYMLHPCVEINMRHNMGYLALKVQKNYLYPSSEGKFLIEYNSEEGMTYRKHREMQQQFSPQIENGRIIKGYLSLCPVSEQSKYRAYILVDN
ncbi:hypothetical protein [Paludibacter sp. 221]|uniref:hypothetical protein n=1 Tax=Paludibacter sp. 221 TaxID=2302939 RepID=UPI001941879F|nr:hypothetical protein [Paludibacter sp. 221]